MKTQAILNALAGAKTAVRERLRRVELAGATGGDRRQDNALRVLPATQPLQLCRAGYRGTAPAAERRHKRNQRRNAKDPRRVGGIQLLEFDPCAYCGDTNPGTFDHITPFSKGGENALENLTRACLPCNMEKGRRSLLLFLALRALKRATPERQLTEGGAENHGEIQRTEQPNGAFCPISRQHRAR